MYFHLMPRWTLLSPWLPRVAGIYARPVSVIAGRHQDHISEPPSTGSPGECISPDSEKVNHVIPSYHELSCSGYNGRLALAFRSANRSTHILSIMETMRAAGERPTNVLCYNYMLVALLDVGRRRDAFYLLHDMETRGMTPDIFTFELLLLDLCRQPTMAITVEEMFSLMQARYGLQPSSVCWDARLRAWMGRNGEHRVLQLFEEMRTNGGRVANDPQFYASAARVAFMRGSWTLLVQMLARIGSGEDQVNWTSHQWYSLLQSRITRLSLQCVPILRIIMNRLSGSLLDEGSYVRILYLCATIGNATADLAFIALSKLSRIYAQTEPEDGRPMALPRAHLEAFVECVECPYQPQHSAVPFNLESKLEIKHQEIAHRIRSLITPAPSKTR